MFELQGKFNTAKVFTDNIEQEAISQIINMCSQKAFEGSKVRIMPDVHAGKGCTIGTTMTITDKVVPNLVGVDIGCGMKTVAMANKFVDFAKVDAAIKTYIPSGQAVHSRALKGVEGEINLYNLCCADKVNIIRAYQTLGTLGGGNHFIEMDRDKNDNLYLVIHSGSRHLGVEVATYYQKEAYRLLQNKFGREARQEIINQLKAEGRTSEIEDVIKNFKGEFIPEEFAYCEGNLFEQYIHDMEIVQKFASLNREHMAEAIIESCNLIVEGEFTTTHNYIDTENMILRKGAVSARDGEMLLIPMNMRDGSLICRGKGNDDWNQSAPHGAGRLMSRSKAKEQVSMEEFEASMANVYSTSVCEGTLDESPMAYKPMDEIIRNVQDTVEITDIIKPVYNYKAHELVNEKRQEKKNQKSAQEPEL